ncbi:MAG TPA: glucose 1-dehydrogenase [Mycobacteriales bacterium]|nr:glucose 1-dehydrogenase [Mycobacteriales bacterium]
MPVLDSFHLTDQVALVTGGSRGIGRALAQALAEAGARVAVTARTAAAAEATATQLRDAGFDSAGFALEVTDPEQVRAVVDAVVERFGGLDVLVNNAGISIPSRALETSEETFRTVLNTNLDGVWRCSVAAAGPMARQGKGTIVNVGSMSAMIVNQPRWQAPYLASKAAVHQLTKALAAEWAPMGIRVNALAPGYILTEASPVDQPEFYPYCVEPAAMKRWGMPEELGPATVFLASDASSFATGSILVIDGGFTLF